MDLDLLASAFPHYAAEGCRVLSETTMGFSGAKVQEVEVGEWRRAGADDAQSDPAPPPRRLFVKHIVFPPLPPSTPEDTRRKDARNRQSYLNEMAVLEEYAPTLRAAGVRVPEMFLARHCPPAEGCAGVESFTFLSESMCPAAAQHAEMDLPQMVSVLRCLARVHATFHGRVTVHVDTHVHDIHHSGVWCQGTHLALAKRPPMELDALPGIWRGLCAAFAWPALAPLGERLRTAAPGVAHSLSSTSPRNRTNTTLVHGDAKPGNVFFLNPDRGGGVCLIDFQWSGVGLAATDIIYLVATASSDDAIHSLDVDADILRPYYDAFCLEYLSSRKDEKLQYSFEDFRYDFQLSTLDYVRWIVACRLKGETPEKYATRRLQLDPNLGSYRRSEVALKFLFDLVDAFLPAVEKQLADFSNY